LTFLFADLALLAFSGFRPSSAASCLLSGNRRQLHNFAVPSPRDTAFARLSPKYASIGAVLIAPMRLRRRAEGFLLTLSGGTL
jgi:hypothetical protein